VIAIVGIVAVLVVVVAGAAVAIVAFSGKPDNRLPVQNNTNPTGPQVNVAGNQRPAIGNPSIGAPVGPSIGTGGPSVGARNKPAGNSGAAAKPPETPPDSGTIPVSTAAAGSTQEIYDYVLKSTVWIINLLGGGKAAEGTGSVIDVNERLILTNYHV